VSQPHRDVALLDEDGVIQRLRVAAVTTARADVFDLREVDHRGQTVATGEWHHHSEPGGVLFRLVSFRSAASRDHVGQEAALHDSPTIDFGVVVSGRIVLVGPGANATTLVQGDAFALHGAPHAWRPLTDDCVLAVVLFHHVVSADQRSRRRSGTTG
jgi:hypothetical protein